MLGVSYFSDRSLVRKAFVWPPLLIGALASLVVATSSHFPFVYIGLIISGACMYAPYGPFWAMIPEMVPRSRGRRVDGPDQQRRRGGRAGRDIRDRMAKQQRLAGGGLPLRRRMSGGVGGADADRASGVAAHAEAAEAGV